MQRWWFFDEPKVTAKKLIDYVPNVGSLKSNLSSVFKQRTFKVIVKQKLDPHEIVYVTGSCNELGNWNPAEAVPLIQNADKTWSLTCNLPDEVIHYRYLICIVEPNTLNVLIRFFETHIKLREMTTNCDQEIISDTFGDVKGIIKIDKGWLTTETLFQFELYNKPFKLPAKYKNQIIYTKIIPMRLHIDTQAYYPSEKHKHCISSDTLGVTVEQPSFSFIEVTKLNATDASFQPQNKYGISFNKDDFILFNITVIDPENVAFLIDLYVYSPQCTKDEPPYHLGYHYILPRVLRKSDGKLELTISCATKHQSIGSIKMEYLKVTPYKSFDFKADLSFLRHWRDYYSGYDISHRGTGLNFTRPVLKTFPENTIDSFKRIALQGANIIEFGVQLSKDCIPVVYNYYDVLLSLKQNKKVYDMDDMLKVPVNRLNLEQLQKLKTYYLLKDDSQNSGYSSESIEENLPFPTLSQLFHHIKPYNGFNIEVKWNMEPNDSTMVHNLTDKNFFVDSILNIVFKKRTYRRVIFSSFDPDICTILRYKQNIYPVLFLSVGKTNKYPSYYDPRYNLISLGINYALLMEFLGITVQINDLYKDLAMIQKAIEKSLITFCWGDDTLAKDIIKNLKSIGIHGVIYDKLDIISHNNFTDNIFLVKGEDIHKYAEFKKKGWEHVSEIFPDECQCICRIFNIKEAREQIALSTVTSFESIESLPESHESHESNSLSEEFNEN